MHSDMPLSCASGWTPSQDRAGLSVVGALCARVSCAHVQERSVRTNGRAHPSPCTSHGHESECLVLSYILLVSHTVEQVHLDYLSAHSTLLRGLFSGVSPLELIDSNSSSLHSTPRGSSYHLPLRSESPSPSPLPSAARGLPIAPLYPRLLPSSPSHPTVYLPVPDPSSFRLLVHYMYFGATTYIEDALDTGAVTWEGLARNVEFLGMDTDIKLCLGRWYSRWQRGRGERSYHAEDFDDDYTDSEDDSFFESDDDELEESSVTSASADEEDQMDIDECFKHVKIDAPMNRGRQRTPRRLGHAISDPGPIRGGMPRRMPHVSQSSSPSSRGMSE